MRLTFRVGDRHVAVDSQRDGERQRLVVDGREYLVAARFLDEDTLLLELEGRRETVHLRRDGRRWRVAVRGSVFDMTAETAATEQHPEAFADPLVVAPMPGKVLQVSVAAGARVAAGDPLLILEAMKMENQLTAPAAGTVEELLVAAGDTVDGGQLLVRLAFD